ncbi:MAG: hypothetical protein M0038_12865 [Pseudomonadota bacterium]|nr:hypothetical protein [Pseudomonadota bacterium]
MADISREDSFLGFEQEDEGLAGDVQIDLGIVPTGIVLSDGRPLVEVGLYLRKLAQSVDETLD